MTEPELTRSAISQWWPKVPNNKTDSLEWRLDVITLLAVIGESSMAEHSQTITASSLCLLPRILPAPQALLKPSRPQRMPQTPAKLTGVHSGVVLDTVGFFANIIHPLDKLQPFEFKILRIEHADLVSSVTRPAAASGSLGKLRYMLRGIFRFRRDREDFELQAGTRPVEDDSINQTGSTTAVDSQRVTDPERGIHRRQTRFDRLTDIVSDPVPVNQAERPAVPAALLSPLHILAVLSMMLTAALLVGAGVWTDGPAIMAVSLISLQSSLVGYASWWKPVLMLRTHNHRVPPGDVMIRTREGAFILIRCTEDVARELYTAGTEECRYHIGERWYKFMMGLGTMMLMLSTVLLGNCSWYMQLFVGSSYICLNAMYWAMGMLPRSLFWDLSRYECNGETPLELQDAHLPTEKKQQQGGGSLVDDQYEGVPSFTRTLWYAIRATKKTGWVQRSGAAPMTEEWKEWLRQAEEAAQDEGTAAEWRAVHRMMEIIAHQVGDQEATQRGSPVPVVDDPGRQHAPLSEVQGLAPGSSAVPAMNHL
ncbi:hypothetical protein MCOR25_008909 [Pyricularia grisea]|uniref:Uncharacterized protein n=1 Tax=Pyricularia grisea TaxID=148305 RepID=A0A6P8AUF9_PYRGI|nr:uncharacterized protein PgNI_08735 [Pyricularia grisea]KAI6353738.1 hypothetical protein MCOR25_008909 [Pyricularia grisea]TLD05799.1 hypothetical protein PgNI_08735 [Pyricularia grisea]